MLLNSDTYHCVKSVQIRSFFWSVFSCIRAEYKDLRGKSRYSVRIRIWTLFAHQILFKLRGTFLECLRRNNLEAIAPILFASSVVQGYGRLDEIACLYGMMWNTPELMKGLLSRLQEATNETGTNFLTFKFKQIVLHFYQE